MNRQIFAGRFLAGATLVAIVASSRSSDAAARGNSSVDRSLAAVGDTIRYVVSVTTTGDTAPNAASPGKIDGFELLGATQSSQQAISMVGGRIDRTVTLTITYRLRAKKVGNYSLGPGRMSVDGNPVATPAINVEVVAAKVGSPAPGTASPSPGRRDPFDDLFLPDDDEVIPSAKTPDALPSDPLAAVPSLTALARAQHVFVRAVPDKTSAIVGEPITTKVFVYTKSTPRISVKRPPQFSDFATIDLGQTDKQWHPITIAGELWQYASIGAYAIYPLKAGKLFGEPVEVQAVLSSPFDPNMGRELDLKSEAMTFDVREPPITGRPAGYVIGDVANGLSVTADVQPKVIKDGHTLATLKLTGVGRIGAITPHLPERPGAKFTLTGDDDKRYTEQLKVKGARTLRFDIGIDQPGDVDLGDVSFIAWDSEKNTYVTVKAALGRVTVAAGAPRPAPSTSVKPAANYPAARTDEGRKPVLSSSLDQKWGPWVWSLLPGMPLTVLAGQGLVTLFARSRKKRSDHADTPASRAQAAFKEALAERDPAKRIGLTQRAFDATLAARFGVAAQGLKASELRTALQQSDMVASELEQIESMRSQLLDARFAGAAGAGDPCKDALIWIEASLNDKLLRSSKLRTSLREFTQPAATKADKGPP